jgi:hypothetical protein
MIHFGLFILFIITIGCSLGKKPHQSIVPTWAHEAIFYKIYPERVNNIDTVENPWRKVVLHQMPTTTDCLRADIKGIVDHMGYHSDAQ